MFHVRGANIWLGFSGMSKRAVLVGVALTSVLGCAATLWWGNKSTTLSLGMSRQQVQALLGPPNHAMAQELNGVMVETWRYLDRTLTFSNGVLQSWSNQP